MAEPAHIRDARPADADAVAAMANALAAEIASGPGGMTADLVRRDLLGREGIGLLVALAAGAPAGYALYTVAYETSYAARGLYLADLYVMPAARRRGLARALLAEVSRRARDGGGLYVWWVTNPGDTAANAAYDRLGAARYPILSRAVHDAPFDRLAAAAGRVPR